MQDNHSSTPFLGITIGLLLLATVVYGAVFHYRQGIAQINAQAAVAAVATNTTTASVAMAVTPTQPATATKPATATPKPAAQSTATPRPTATPQATAKATATKRATATATAALTAGKTVTKTNGVTASTVVTTSALITTNAALTSTAVLTNGAPLSITATTTNTQAAAPPKASDAVVAAINKAGCAGCHTIPGVPAAVGVIGPNLSNIGLDGATRKADYTAAEYILESLRTPNEFLAPKCPTGPCIANIMPQNLTQTLTAEEIETIVNYLVTLQSGE